MNFISTHELFLIYRKEKLILLALLCKLEKAIIDLDSVSYLKQRYKSQP